MSTISDRIEKYLKTLIEKEEDYVLEIQRTEIAETFSCVPSQVNYVLKTRFSETSGYKVETKRGGGGYIKITKVPTISEKEITRIIRQNISDVISEKKAINLLNKLFHKGFLKDRERLLLIEIIKDETLGDFLEKDAIRAVILKRILSTFLHADF